MARARVKGPSNKSEITVLHEITLSGHFADRLGGPRTLRFVPGVNVLCGANGSGKSTVLEAIVAGAKDPKCPVKVRITGGRFFYKDFEKDNPRVGDRGMALMEGKMTLAAIIWEMRELSHGQATKALNAGLTTPELAKALLMLDEPEQALDLDGLVQLRDGLKSCAASQIIIATHAPLLILDPSFHLVEMTAGYRDRVAAAVREWAASTIGAQPDQPAPTRTRKRAARGT